ncbi:MAG: DUF6010 family protein [Candidatus Hodarchaeota archaeon]
MLRISQFDRVTILAVISGITLAILAIFFSLLLTNVQMLDFYALLLTFIAGVYLGFLLLDGQLKKQNLFLEIGAMGITVIFSLLGLWYSELFLIVGYFFHGIWDIIHHPRGVQTKIPEKYSLFCLIFDWIVAIFLIITLFILI